MEKINFEFFEGGFFSHAHEDSPELRYAANRLKILIDNNFNTGEILSDSSVNFIKKYTENDPHFKLLYVFHMKEGAAILVPKSVKNVFGFSGLFTANYGEFLDRVFLEEYEKVIRAIPKNLIGTYSEFNFFV